MIGIVKQCWLESGGVYGYRKITDDLRDLGEACGKHRVYRLMAGEGFRPPTSYRRRLGHHAGEPAVIAPNQQEKDFEVDVPNKVWVRNSGDGGHLFHRGADTNSDYSGHE